MNNVKKYVVYQPNKIYGINAHLVIGNDELNIWVQDGSIDEDTLVYEVAKTFKLKIKRKETKSLVEINDM